MSVINDMLRDLEKRKAPEREQIAPVSVSAVIEPQQGMDKGKWALLALSLVCVALLVFTWLLPVGSDGQQSGSKLPLSEAGSPPRPAAEQAHIAPSQPISSIEQDHKHGTGGQANKLVTMPAAPDTKAANNMPDEVETTDARAIPERVIPERAVTLAPSKPDSNNRIEGALPPADAEALAMQTEPSVQVVLDKQKVIEGDKRANATQGKPPAFEAKGGPSRVELTPEARDAQVAQQATELFLQRKPREAYRLLYEFVTAHEIDRESKAVLASHLLQDGRTAEAGDILLTVSVADDPNLRQIKARWLMATDEHNLALHTLRTRLPALEIFPEYYALLASLYQQQGYPQQAAQTYSKLVEYDRDAADWWAGLAIALDQAERYEDALSAYQAALALAGLNPRLASFADQRVRELIQ